MTPQQIKQILNDELVATPFTFLLRHANPTPGDFRYPNGLTWLDYGHATEKMLFEAKMMCASYNEPVARYGQCDRP